MTTPQLPAFTETLVIGAGPAGSAAAALLNRAGHECTVIEKQAFPRFSIGESLIPQCMDILQEAGLLEAVQEQGYQVKTGALFRRLDRKSGFDFGRQFTHGWNYTYQVPRDHFDHVLAAQVQARGVPIHFRHGIRSAVRENGSWTVTVEDPDGSTHTLETPFILDASGYGHVLPRLLGLTAPSTLPVRVSVFAHFESDPGDPDTGKDTIVIGSHPERPDAWYWTIPFSNGRTSAGAVGSPEFVDALGTSSAEKFARLIAMEPNLARRFEGVETVFEPRELRGYSHSVKALHGDGFAILGHAGEFLDPVFSSGVALSLKSASLAAAARIRELNGEPVDWASDYARELLHGVQVFKTFVQGWYSGLLQKVIYSPTPDNDYTRQICSIFAGYVWDRENKVAVQHQRSLPLIAALCENS